MHDMKLRLTRTLTCFCQSALKFPKFSLSLIFFGTVYSFLLIFVIFLLFFFLGARTQRLLLDQLNF